ncbi:MAG: hypothetical protein M3360_05970 [Actinomycetota bacterium]|nr:hypothetical protein [Actinomycetota bacterium]
MKVHWHGNMARALDEEGYRGALRVFCSQRCRSRYGHDRAGTRRIEERIEAGPVHCAECEQVLEARRSDSIYCSSACRQRAYRKRKGRVGCAI